MRAVLAVAAVLAICPAARATDNDFKALVRAISAEFHAKPMSPWAIRFAKLIAPPVRGMDVAIWEDLGPGRSSSEQFFERLNGIVGTAWKPFVKVRSRDESSLVYMRDEGGVLRLLIATIEPGEATVVHLKLSPERAREWFGEPVEMASNKKDRDR